MRPQSLSKALPILIILIVASIFRLTGLLSTPPGMPFDEIVQAETSLGGISSWSATSPIIAAFSAFQSASLILGGHNLLAVRLLAALVGLLTLAFTYAWARRTYNQDIALIASAFLAVSFWPIVLSRIGLAGSLAAMLAAALSWLASRATTRRAQIRTAVLAAILLIALAVSWRISDFDTLVAGAGRAMLLWTNRGDPFFHLNVGELPVFNIGLGVIFLLGLLAVPPGRTGWARNLPLAWIALGWLNATLTEPERGFQSASVALSATYIGLALGFSFVGRLFTERFPTRAWQPVVMMIIVTFAGAEASWRAFYIGPANPQARRDFNTDYFHIKKFLETQPPNTRAAIATTDPHRIPPALFEFISSGENSPLWFDPALALAIPSGDKAQVLITSGAVVSPRFDQALGQAVSSHEDQYLSGDLAHRVYTFPPSDTLYESLELGAKGVWVSDVVAFPPDDPEGVRRPVSYPVLFGDVLELVGYRGPVTRQAGQNLLITILWRVKRAAASGEAISIFAHLLTADGQLVAQRDVLAVPPFGWESGDSFLQLQDISLEGVAPGKYHLQVGVYTIDGPRFPVMLDGAPAGDRLLLEPVEVTP